MLESPNSIPAAGLPFRFGTSDQYAGLRAHFRDSGFTPSGIGERLGIPDVHEFVSLRGGREGSVEVSDELDAMIRLFLDGERVPRQRLEAFLPPGALELLESLSLVAPHPEQADGLAATVRLYPVEGAYVASDLAEDAPGVADERVWGAEDQVYPASAANTRNFLRMLPRTPTGRFLELCAGTGIAALLSAPNATRVWATDIAERATGFAEFNARLNGLANFEALCGDLYEPVADLTFDRIAAHPPYIPGGSQNLIYAHAGEDGEEVLRGLLAGVPAHLAPGGRLYCTCRATDRVGRPLEQRIREMLGAGEAEFDVLVVSHYEFHPTEYYSRLAAAGRVGFSLVEQRHLMYRRHEVERIVYSSFVVQRHASRRSSFTLRRDRGSAWNQEMEWLVDLSTAIAEGRAAAHLMGQRLRLSADAQLRVVHQLEDGEWKPASLRIHTERPFPRAVDTSMNLAILLTMFDGTVTGTEALERLRSTGALPPEAPDEAFTQMLEHLVREGVLEV